MTESHMYPAATRDLATKRAALAPKADAAFRAFNDAVFADGALTVKIKQLIAVAAAHVTQCPYCIRGHTRAALRAGATREELMEAIWVAAEMRAGAAYAHSALALDAMDELDQRSGTQRCPQGRGALARTRRVARRGVVFPLDSAAGAETLAHAPAALAAETQGPETKAMRQQLGALIESRVDALTEVFRGVLVLRPRDTFSVEERRCYPVVSRSPGEGRVRQRVSGRDT